MTRRETLSVRLAAMLNTLLDDQPSWSARSSEALGSDGRPMEYFAVVQRVADRLMFLETIAQAGVEERIVRTWILSPQGPGQWCLDSAEKNHEEVPGQWLDEELVEATLRLSGAQSARLSLEVAAARSPLAPVVSVAGNWERQRRRAFLVGLAGCVLLVALGFGGIQYQRMLRLVGDLDRSIAQSSAMQNRVARRLGERVESLSAELEGLRADVSMEKDAFLFSRRQTAMTLRDQAQSLSYRDFSQAKAINYLASQIEKAATYGEVLYQLSRIPENNAQAETLLAIDRPNVVPLSSYKSTVLGLGYPVRFDGQAWDGSDFMISSGFGDPRASSLGTGGFLPHQAVDIINIRNILTVTPENTIVRFPGVSGSVVSAAEGKILRVAYDEIYGWNAEVQHPLSMEWRERFKGIQQLTTFYAHMAERPSFEAGSFVEAGGKLGNIGQTGRSTGPHLHYEVRVYRSEGEGYNRFGRFDRVNPYILKEPLVSG
ncbi:MAG: M23 family metallopeptidase [Spirochaetales bacterium]|nr:M23 family metallopeptidase [Spirochaetales bacterium]